MTSASTPGSDIPRPGSIALFLLLAAVTVLAMQVTHGFFPGNRPGALWGRFAGQVAALALLILGSRWLLARDGLPRDQLGLGTGVRSRAAFLIGAALAVSHILALMVGMYAVAPFELSRGALPGTDVGLAAVGYLTGNFAEELAFRGYLLVALARWMGTTPALWLLALPFGLFHFPGLDAEALGKMVLTTGAMHFVYAYVFLATRSLWAAIACHAVGNTLLHSVIGIGKPAFLSVHYQRDFPSGIDAPFWIFWGVSVSLALVLAKLPATKRGVAWLEGSPGTAVTPASSNP